MNKEVLEGNKLIAEFMGAYFVNDAPYVYPDGYYMHKEVCIPHVPADFQFHESWDWLMPVVEKVEAMGFNVRIEGISCSIRRLCEDEVVAAFVCGDRSKKLEIIHSTLVKFIESYNKNKNQ